MSVKKFYKLLDSYKLLDMNEYPPVYNELDILNNLCKLFTKHNINYSCEYDIIDGRPDLGKGDIIVKLKKNIFIIIELKFINYNKKNKFINEKTNKLCEQIDFYGACQKIKGGNITVIGLIIYNDEESFTIENDLPLSIDIEYEECFQDIKLKDAKKIILSRANGEVVMDVLENKKNKKKDKKNKNIKTKKNNQKNYFELYNKMTEQEPLIHNKNKKKKEKKKQYCSCIYNLFKHLFN